MDSQLQHPGLPNCVCMSRAPPPHPAEGACSAGSGTGAESVAAVIFWELHAALVPGVPQMLRHARVVGVGKESDSWLGTLPLPSFSGPIHLIQLCPPNIQLALKPDTWKSCLFPSLIPKLLRSSSPLLNAISSAYITSQIGTLCFSSKPSLL